MAGRFSERIGKREPKVLIQTETMDRDLRNGLWSVIDVHITGPMQKHYYIKDSGFSIFFQEVYFSFYKEPIDYVSTESHSNASDLRKRFFAWSALDVYDFLDFIAGNQFLSIRRATLTKDLNYVLERELSGYRFINGELAPITSEAEVKSIEQALRITTNSSYKGASIHLAAALEKLSDRREPDYRNSIKEAISAVESVCQVIAGDTTLSLGKAIKVIEKTNPMHEAFKRGLLSIYGYTSDSDGIRHALHDEPNLKQEDALFMLVTCSAFVNYFIAKSNGIINT